MLSKSEIHANKIHLCCKEIAKIAKCRTPFFNRHLNIITQTAQKHDIDLNILKKIFKNI